MYQFSSRSSYLILIFAIQILGLVAFGMGHVNTKTSAFCLSLLLPQLKFQYYGMLLLVSESVNGVVTLAALTQLL